MPDRKLAHTKVPRSLEWHFQLLGLEPRLSSGAFATLRDGGGNAGRLYVRGDWAMVVLDRWQGRWYEEQIALAVPVVTSLDDLWEWINDAAGVWPVTPLGPRTERSHGAPSIESFAPPTHHQHIRVGEKAVLPCRNYTIAHGGSSGPHTLLRARPRYMLWQCDECKFRQATPRR